MWILNSRLSLPTRRFAALVLFATLLFSCAPRPTSTPELAPSNHTVPTPTAIAFATSVPRETVPPAGETKEPVETPEQAPSPRPRLYDEVTEEQILQAFYPNIPLAQAGEHYQAGGSADWTVWVNDREEGVIQLNGAPGLITIVANQVGASPPAAEASYGPSGYWLAFLQKSGDQLQVIAKTALQPAQSPDATDVYLERVLDVERDGIDELLITRSTAVNDIVHVDATLYRWQGGPLVELWKGVEQDDNTGASGQDQYSSYTAVIDLDDVNTDGNQEIIVDSERIEYNKDAQGEPDFANPKSTLDERTVYTWDGKAFVLDRALSTPAAPPPTDTP